jgi:hypothetical protein
MAAVSHLCGVHWRRRPPYGGLSSMLWRQCPHVMVYVLIYGSVHLAAAKVSMAASDLCSVQCMSQCPLAVHNTQAAPSSLWRCPRQWRSVHLVAVSTSGSVHSMRAAVHLAARSAHKLVAYVHLRYRSIWRWQQVHLRRVVPSMAGVHQAASILRRKQCPCQWYITHGGSVHVMVYSVHVMVYVHVAVRRSVHVMV